MFVTPLSALNVERALYNQLLYILCEPFGKKKNWKFTTKYNLHSFVFPFCMHDVYMVQPAAAASQLIFMALSLGVNVVVFSRVENSRISSIQKDCSD